MEILDVTTIRAMVDLCAALGKQHFYVGPIYGHRTHRRMNNCFIHCDVHKLLCFSSDHVRLWNSDSEGSLMAPLAVLTDFEEKFFLWKISA
jgi:hypothetical protein